MEKFEQYYSNGCVLSAHLSTKIWYAKFDVSLELTVTKSDNFFFHHQNKTHALI